MLEFLQGFSFGLLLSCMPWFMLGMFNPRLALPVQDPSRWQLVLRYWVVAPAIGLLGFTTSLWGGLEPSLAGWLAGLAAIPGEIFVERRWRGLIARRRAARAARQREQEALHMQQVLERQQRESGLRVLDTQQLPSDADDTVRALAEVKRRLLGLQRPDVAIQADRLYSRYSHALEVIGTKFDRREITYERSRGLVSEVTRGAVDNLGAMSSLAAGVVNIDAAFVRRRISQLGAGASEDERMALETRLVLIDETEHRLRELGGRVEAALTALDDAAVAVSRVDTGRPQASLAADQALAELRRFSEKADIYGRNA